MSAYCTVDEIAASLVREYLSRKGLKQTLSIMDAERPRTRDSISNRAVLARAVHIEKLMKKNKEKNYFQTMIEIMANYFIEKSTSSTTASSSSTSAVAMTTTNQQKQSDIRSASNRTNISDSPSVAGHGVTRLRGDDNSLKPHRMREWVSNDQKISHGTTVASYPGQALPRGLDTRLDTTPKTSSATPLTETRKLKSSILGDLVCEDLEEEEEVVGGVGGRNDSLGLKVRAVASLSEPLRITGTPVTMETAKNLKELIFGTASGRSFNQEWRRQDFSFSELPGLEYGLVQYKGGPCGILACVQAFILKHLLFSDKVMSPERGLVLAMTEILWMLGEKRGRAILALPSSSISCHNQRKSLELSHYSSDQLTERIVLFAFSDKSSLEEFIAKNIYQVLINLLLTGQAVSNVFDNDITLDTGTSHESVLQGIHAQSQIGFLSLFEHYGNCIVGSHYKEPVYPIWVVCSESHFTVLFSRQKHLLTNWELQRKFDLFYYDGLANQTEEIKLTIDTVTVAGDDKKYSQYNDLIPPLELCIRTKWRNAAIDWNNTEPLL